MAKPKRSAKTLLTCLVLITASCATSRVYSPELPVVTPRTGALSGDRVAVGVFDARTDTASSAVLRAELISTVQRAYPSATVTAIRPDSFFKPAVYGVVTLRITVQAFGSGFGVKAVAGMAKVGSFNAAYIIVPEGKWNGVTAIQADLKDWRGSTETTRDTTIRIVVSLPNSSGYSTARNALDAAFGIVSQGLLSWVDQTTMR